ncbi:hypothetical protein, variant [Aphanomyces invadans]|uniref:Presenilin n=1 Tax=Aphanomyces invadans TaxID=157072 RepID=A0A024UUE4_9STRA|nr:hypothetical protein, variant [Aphanomyces invadans]ETW09537.1 hypothetical protein, variant [Aphanomyces invadans]|eukprot:XP_008860948.1 hypothetical protein, variant [Aphanomyces invadans]
MATEAFKTTFDEPLLAPHHHPPPKDSPSSSFSLGYGLSLGTVVTQLNSFLAVLWPVQVTMVLASIVAVSMRDPDAERSMSRYLYYKDIDESIESTSTKVMEALTNALVIIFFIAIVTFAVVLMYKVNCMGGLQGYLMASSATLLGLVGSVLAEKIVCERLLWHVDAISMTFVMYNFAIVGTLSIFYQKGVSPDVGRAYLVVTSVIMSWQLCQLPSWSTWAILCGLAFWDLFAVLTPCGPLRCLVNLIHSEGRPMPGLLYEAEIKATHKNSPNYTNGSFYTAHNLQAAHGAGVYKAPLYTSQTAPIVYAIPVAGASTNLARQQVVFENQLLEFCRDYNSPHSDHVATVAKQYLHKQQECWQLLYTKYNVSYIRSNRSYPSYAEVFDGTPMPDLDTQEKETIKLGLGDFIFYSVLVARAAMTSFGAFIACFLCVIVVRCRGFMF